MSDLKMHQNGTNVGNSLTTIDAGDYFSADVKSFSDYYPFGSALPTRIFAANSYRYGFNGMEKDDEIAGDGNIYNFFGARSVYDSRVGRFTSTDPKSKIYKGVSPYNFAGNSPIAFIDLDGAGPVIYAYYIFNSKTGEPILAGLKRMQDDRESNIVVYKVFAEAQYFHFGILEGEDPLAYHFVEIQPNYLAPGMSMGEYLSGLGKNRLPGQKFDIHLFLDGVGMVPIIGEPADILNGVIYAVEGDALNAGISVAGAIPLYGWASTGSRIVYKTVKNAVGVTVGLKFTKNALGIIEFGNRSMLRRIINAAGGTQAHHIIPWELRTNKVVQIAAEKGFHMNDIVNGIALPLFKHSGSHKAYNNYVKAELKAFEDAMNAAGKTITPDAAEKFLVEKLIPKLKFNILNNDGKIDLIYKNLENFKF